MSIRTGLSTIFACMLAAPFAGSVSAAPPMTCDATYVSRSRHVFTVKPTGSADTANLQCAFDAAVAAGAGAEVRLTHGEFHTAQIVVNNFHGRWQGAGMDRTVIINLPNLGVGVGDFYVNPPSASNPHPFLFSFINGDVSVLDLAIKIAGVEPTTGWTIYGLPIIKSLAAAIAFEGSHIDVHVDHIMVTGEVTNDYLYGYNLYNGIYYEGFIGTSPQPPVTGSYYVTNSKFYSMASGSPWYNVANSKIVISNNVYDGVMSASEGSDLANTTYEFSQNKVNAAIGVSLYDASFNMQSSSLLIKNNEFRGNMGIDIELTFFGEENRCLIEGNNLQRVISDPSIVLGPATKGCVVKGVGNKTSVLDLGTGNTIIGGNRHDKGDRPKPHTLIAMHK